MPVQDVQPPLPGFWLSWDLIQVVRRLGFLLWKEGSWPWEILSGGQHGQ